LTTPLPPLLHPILRAAERLGLSESSIWRLIQAGTLHPTCVLGRTMISEVELQRLVTEATKPRQRVIQPVVGTGVNTRDAALPDASSKRRLKQTTK
jgi:hypothetical protein